MMFGIYMLIGTVLTLWSLQKEAQIKDEVLSIVSRQPVLTAAAVFTIACMMTAIMWPMLLGMDIYQRWRSRDEEY